MPSKNILRSKVIIRAIEYYPGSGTDVYIIPESLVANFDTYRETLENLDLLSGCGNERIGLMWNELDDMFTKDFGRFKWFDGNSNRTLWLEREDVDDE